MKTVVCAALAGLAFCGGAWAQADTADKRVSLPAEAGLVVGHQEQAGRSVLVELIPAGETVQTFSRMVTLQTAPDMGDVPPGDFLAAFRERYAASCPNSNVTPVPMGAASGLRIDCPRHPATDRMETVFVRVLDLGRDLGVVQITMRNFVAPADGQWARGYLGRVTVE